ncbi:MAG: hypothetical protein IT262_07325 [Saprospiraceae bacterium]|nr:hypothetical protein [Saprospiraceae bacterium]
MISLSPQELQQLETQINEVVMNVIGKAGGILSGMAVSPHWISHSDALQKLGWPKILLKRGVELGHLHPIVIPGTGGTQYDLEELMRYKHFLMDERRESRLHPHYISNFLAQSKPDTHVHSDNQGKRPAKRGLPRRNA